MEQLFGVIPVRRRSPAGTALGVGLHLATTIGAICVTEASVFERPPPPRKSINVVMIGPELLLAVPPREALVASRIPFEATPPVEEPVLPPPPSPMPGPAVTRIEAPDTETPKPIASDMPFASEPTMPRAPELAGGVADAAATAIVGVFDRVVSSRVRPGPDRPAAAIVPAGFESGGAAPGVTAAPVDAVDSGGFDLRPAPRAPAPGAAPQEHVDTPVEIIFKPAPAYTDEARALKIEGAVILDVEFTASSEVRVLRIVGRLGYGLDEAAARAAGQIRFRPARRGGRAIDFRATIHIEFRLT